jgi:hypothetical protein
MFFNLRLKREGDRMISWREQPGRDDLMRGIEQLRQVGGANDREGLGRWALSIPFEDWLRLRTKYPELASPDSKIKTRAYLRFMRSPESWPYRMREKI